LGLIELRPREFNERERKFWGGRGWLVGGARLSAWGTAVTWALLDARKKVEDETESENDEAASEAAELPGFCEMSLDLSGADAGKVSDPPARLDGSPAQEDPADEAAACEPEPEFGMLQPIFHPYFPEWQHLYARPRPEARQGAHIFKVTLAGWQGGGGGIWRRLAVPPDTSLDEFAGAILSAFDFDGDHLYDFHYRDQRGKLRIYNHPETHEGPFTTDIAVNKTEMALKDTMHFTFDYGDNWQFEVRLDQVEAEPCRRQRVKVVASAGKAPAQYPEFEG
jgi:hypothetical protein